MAQTKLQERPDYTTDSNDINQHIQPNENPVKNRSVDPLNPQYNLPTYQTIAPETQKFMGNRTLDINDIPGTLPVPVHYSKNLHAIPKTRNHNLDVSDISYIRGQELDVHPRNEQYNNMTTKDVVTSNPKFSPTRHEKDVFVNVVYHHENPKKDHMQHDYLKTEDMDGLHKEQSTKFKYKYGNRQELHDNTFCKDINAMGINPEIQKPELKHEHFHLQPNEFSPDKIGREYYPQKPQSPQKVCGVTYASPDIFQHKYSDYKNASIKQSPEHMCPPYVHKTLPAPDPKLVNADFKHLFAGVNSGMLRYCIKHQTVGWLPGPQADSYRIKPTGFNRVPHHLGGPHNNYQDIEEKPKFHKTLKLGHLHHYDAVKEQQEQEQKKALSQAVKPCSERVNMRLLSPERKQRDRLLVENMHRTKTEQEKIRTDTDRQQQEVQILTQKDINQVHDLPW